MHRGLARIFEVDLRSLALFRVAVGCVFLWDVVTRASDLRAHYSEDGLMPVWVAAQVHGAAVHATPFAWLSSQPLALAGLFAIMVVAGLLLVLGYRTRAATAVCWLLLVLLQMRNHAVFFGGDALLRVLLFWSLFLPLGARWSRDALRTRTGTPSPRFVSLGSAALLLQIATVYWATGLQKTDPAWSDGSAVWYALNVEVYATRIAIWLRELDWLIPVLTHGSRMLEIFGPCVAFSPIWRGPLRTLVVLAFGTFHLGLWLCLDIGFFQPLSMVAWLAFLPTWFWDDLLPRFGVRVGASEHGASPIAASRWLEVAVVVPLAYLVLFMSATAGGMLMRGRSLPLPGPVAIVGRVLRLNQQWGMFVDFTDRRDQWLVVDATLENGQHVDPYRGAPLAWQTPEPLARRPHAFRWRMIGNFVLQPKEPEPDARIARAQIAEYMCREWNASHPDAERMDRLELVGVQELTRRDAVVPLAPVVLHRHRCGAGIDDPSRSPPPAR